LNVKKEAANKEFILVCYSKSKEEVLEKWKKLKTKECEKFKQMILFQGDKKSNKEFKDDYPDEVFDHVYI